ncbi:hypothetical protein EhV256 [Emiliania huxleyi virus 86]|uniref:Protein kinase domain-containing protein n=1 Tax=Emiliania huxleyi virus 86 (isolate United Kingdom/English Channel/1999) TaxID=654925 RepID=Q4A2M6_EHV8U|nr:hypothetical protein EhV256 [Emiliania huxleyi virus 86]AHA55883.1 hypothetical protein EhV164_00296 [Emiliania huxleyi virus 164]CAI65680.1 hypothetical protein EhV256 [Emiliania huxleyi virus 86]
MENEATKAQNIQNYIGLALYQLKYVYITFKNNSNLVIEDQSTNNVYTLPPPVEIGNGINGTVFSFPQNPNSLESCFVIKKVTIPYSSNIEQNRIRLSRFLQEVALTKMYGDMGIGPPCNMTPTDALDQHLFVANDKFNDPDNPMESKTFYIIINRMIGDMITANELGLYADYVNNGDISAHIELTLSDRINAMLQSGLLFVDIKPDNILFITPEEATRQNQVRKRIHGAGTYDESYPTVFLTDFDTTHACSLFNEYADVIYQDLYGNALFKLPKYNSLYKQTCLQNPSELDLLAYGIMIRGIIGSTLIHFFEQDTNELAATMKQVRAYNIGKLKKITSRLYPYIHPFLTNIRHYGDMYDYLEGVSINRDLRDTPMPMADGNVIDAQDPNLPLMYI